MTRQKVKELIPLALIIGYLVYTTIIALATDVLLTKHWLAYGFTSMVILTYFLNKTVSNIILGLTIILGLLNILAFTPTIMTIGAGITWMAFDAEVMIALQAYSLLVFVTFVYAHGKAFMTWINKDGL